MPKKRKPRKPLPGKFPPGVINLLQAQQLQCDGFICCAQGDMNNEGLYCNAWIAFDEQGLYLAFGQEKTVPGKRRKKHLELEYSLDKLETIPVRDITKLKVEQYVTTGRLIAQMGEHDYALTRFSLGLAGSMQKLADCFNAMREDRDMTPYLEENDESMYCPKCNTKYPNKRRVCPQCIKRSTIARRLLTYFNNNGLAIAAMLVMLAASAVLQVLLPLFSTQRLFDDVLIPATQAGRDYLPAAAEFFASLTRLVLIVVLMRVLDMVFTVGTDLVNAYLFPGVMYKLKLKIFEAMQRLSVGFYSGKQTGSLMERMTRDSMSIHWFFIDGVPFAIRNVFMFATLLVLMFRVSWQMTLLVLGVIPVMGIVVPIATRLFRRLYHRIWASNARLNSLVSDNINGQRVIKAFAREEEELGRFSEMSESLREAEKELTSKEATVFPFAMSAVFLLIVAVLVMGGRNVQNGTMGLGELMAFVAWLMMIQGPLEYFSWVSNWWARCADAASRVFEIIDSDDEILPPEHPAQVNELRGDIELRELEFEYEPARPIIKRVNLSVGAGQMLGIVGKTGAGKSTIANLISRLYDAKAGAILIDGVDVKDLPLDVLRRNIGLVSQDIYLFSGTIADNIRYARPQAGMQEVIAAAKASAAHDFIMKLPDGYETYVGASGQALSGGERQRVSIARAIMQNPKILILDEATAAMDTATERSIQQSLQQLKEGRTTIAIAHRLSTLRDADMLAVIEDGELKEFGTFRELLKKRGAFYELYQVQSKALAAMHIG
ncbi:MAG: ABC transporter ATP-binding protein/permease [Oscillospiraceae bacterium]|nr:ABC transporter ATP-binding protein/permease [Oscillospiraceae bacterium]